MARFHSGLELLAADLNGAHPLVRDLDLGGIRVGIKARGAVHGWRYS